MRKEGVNFKEYRLYKWELRDYHSEINHGYNVKKPTPPVYTKEQEKLIKERE